MSLTDVLLIAIVTFYSRYVDLNDYTRFYAGLSQVMATLIYDEYMQLLDWASGSALAFTLTFMAVAIIFLSSRLTRRWAGAA